jgi:hypothetical protein
MAAAPYRSLIGERCALADIKSEHTNMIIDQTMSFDCWIFYPFKAYRAPEDLYDILTAY